MTRLIGPREIKLIHVAKRALALTEDEYLAALSSVGVTTSKDLSPARYALLMAHFKACGFTPTSKRQHRPHVNPHAKPPEDKEALLQKIGAILAELGLPWAYADSIAAKRFSTDKCLWLDPSRLYKVTQMLAVHQARVRAKQPTDATQP
jgi:phage gp16-like protein